MSLNGNEQNVDNEQVIPWTKRIGNRNAGKESNIPWWVNDKFKLHKFCKEHGFPTPEVYAIWKTPDEMNFAEAPKKFVIKPTVMFSMWGVMLLEKLDDGTFYDELKGRHLTEEQIRDEQQQVYERCKYKGAYRLMMEAKIEGEHPGKPIPFDYKVSVFYDQPGQVLQIDRNPDVPENAFFDGQFSPLDLEGTIVSDWSKKKMGQHVRPHDYEKMLQLAIDVTKAIGTPYMRVDMFVGPNGPVIGELTASPGDAFYGNNYKFSEAYDLELGKAWSEAELRLASDA